ncbi:MAG: small multi-drug export protein [Methanosarcinaceae archaeon]|nr:small multi-drug export protein [Methanosarcinaceae archaeon]
MSIGLYLGELLYSVPHKLVILFISMLPVVELRGAIPVALTLYKMDPLFSFLLSVIGNMIPVFFIFYLLRPVSDFFSPKHVFFEKFFNFIFSRAERKGKEKVQKYQSLALAIFVGIPLPLTGAWTGTVIALVFGIPFRKAFPSILAGVIIAGIIMTFLTQTGLSLWDLFTMYI